MQFFKITYEIIKDAVASVLLFISTNLWRLARMVDLLLPFDVLYICAKTNDVNLCFAVAVVAIVLSAYMKAYANKIGKGIDIPVPAKRFTEVDEDGEVSVEVSRTQELLLYMGDLEDWMQRKGLIK